MTMCIATVSRACAGVCVCDSSIHTNVTLWVPCWDPPTLVSVSSQLLQILHVLACFYTDLTPQEKCNMSRTHICKPTHAYMCIQFHCCFLVDMCEGGGGGWVIILMIKWIKWRGIRKIRSMCLHLLFFWYLSRSLIGENKKKNEQESWYSLHGQSSENEQLES